MNTNALPAAAIHIVISRPCFSAAVPASSGEAVAPNISPTMVTTPIDVARNCAGTLSVGTNTKVSEPIPCPVFARKTIPASSQGYAYKLGTT
jgi:hypothetical protein